MAKLLASCDNQEMSKHQSNNSQFRNKVHQFKEKYPLILVMVRNQKDWASKA
jgi:hypothetical protein